MLQVLSGAGDRSFLSEINGAKEKIEGSSSLLLTKETEYVPDTSVWNFRGNDFAVQESGAYERARSHFSWALRSLELGRFGLSLPKMSSDQ